MKHQKLNHITHLIRLILLYFSFLTFNAHAQTPGTRSTVSLQTQTPALDSLQKILQTTKEDTTRVNTLNALARKLNNHNPDTAILLSSQALKLAAKVKYYFGFGQAEHNLGVLYRLKSDYELSLTHYTKALMVWESLEKNISLGNKSSIINKRATTLSNIGFVYSEQSDYHKALDYYFKALKMKEEIGDKKGKTTTLVNIGNVYNRQSDHAKALDYYFRALKMSEEIGDKNGIANNLCGIGLVYSEQSDYPRALDYYFRALKMQEEIGDKYGIAINLGNIGNVYYRQSDYPRALDYYFRVLKMQEEIGDKKGIARNLGNIGLVYSNQSDYPQALDHYFRALKMKEEIGDKYEMANTLGNIGVLYTRTKKYKDAEEYLQKALTLCDSIKALYYTMHFEKFYSNLDSARGNHRGSLMHYKKYIVARDSIFNEENNKKQARVEIKYEMEKAQLIKAQQEKEAARIEKETRDRRDHLQYSLIVLGLVVIITPLSFISRLKVKPRIAEGMIFMVFLIFFEFVLVLLDPYLDLITGGAPGLKLLVNALIAAFIFPFHAVCERWVKGRILRGGGVQTQVL